MCPTIYWAIAYTNQSDTEFLPPPPPLPPPLSSIDYLHRRDNLQDGDEFKDKKVIEDQSTGDKRIGDLEGGDLTSELTCDKKNRDLEGGDSTST